MKLKYRKMLGDAVNRFYPNTSHCGRCNLNWHSCKLHNTSFTKQSGCFPLCEDCWEELKTPQNRLPYYTQLFHEWGGESVETWNNIKQAVLDGG